MTGALMMCFMGRHLSRGKGQSKMAKSHSGDWCTSVFLCVCVCVFVRVWIEAGERWPRSREIALLVSQHGPKSSGVTSYKYHNWEVVNCTGPAFGI